MSLREFHLFFIAVAALFSGIMALWGFGNFGEEALGSAARPFAVVAGILAAALALYGWRFAQRNKPTPQ